MHSSRTAGLAAALAMSLSAGVVGVANAGPTASPDPTQSSPAVTAGAPGTPTTSPGSEESPSTKAIPSPESPLSSTESEAPSSLATPKPSASTPSVSAHIRATQQSVTGTPLWMYLTTDLRTGAGTSYRSMGKVSVTAQVSRRGADYKGWAPILYKTTKAWVPANTVTNWHPQTQWIYLSSNLRTGAGNNYRSMNKTTTTHALVRRGPNHNGWAPVYYQNKQGWLPGNTVTSTRPQTFWVKTNQTIRTGASKSARSMGTAHQGDRVVRCGPNYNRWAPVLFNNRQTWVPASSLSSRRVAAPPTTLPISNAGVHLDRRCLTGTVICGSKSQRKIWMVQNGRILITLDARYGRSSMPTAEGVHSVYWKDKNHVSSTYGSPMPYSMFFYKGQAIHYSAGFAKNGWVGGSHGCINIRNMNGLKWLWNHTPTGRKVIIYK